MPLAPASSSGSLGVGGSHYATLDWLLLFPELGALWNWAAPLCLSFLIWKPAVVALPHRGLTSAWLGRGLSWELADRPASFRGGDRAQRRGWQSRMGTRWPPGLERSWRPLPVQPPAPVCWWLGNGL